MTHSPPSWWCLPWTHKPRSSTANCILLLAASPSFWKHAECQPSVIICWVNEQMNNEYQPRPFHSSSHLIQQVGLIYQCVHFMGGATESRESQWLAWSVTELRLKCKLVCLRGQCALRLSSPCAMWTFYPWMLGILECQLQILIFHQINQVIREVTLRCSGKYRKLSIFSFLFLFHNIGFLLKSPLHWPLIIASPPPPAPTAVYLHTCLQKTCWLRTVSSSCLGTLWRKTGFTWFCLEVKKPLSESLQTVVMTKNNWATVFFHFSF